MAFLPALLLFLPILFAQPIFLAGFSNGNITVLCEGGQRAFVSPPGGSPMQLALDSHSQAYFHPAMAGPHAVQCGSEVSIVQVAFESPAQGEQKIDGQAGAILLLASFAAAALLSILSFFALGFLLQKKTSFIKQVQGSTARLELFAGDRLSKIEISDPVAMRHSGQPLSFSIPSLSAGQAWSYEYEIGEPRLALPASLVAIRKNEKISLLSKILIEGEGVQGAQGGKQPAPKMKLKRA